MNHPEPDDNLEDLLSIIDTVATDKLKRQGYQKYVDKIADVARGSLKVDGTRLTIVIQYIKCYKNACFQRDVLIDVLKKLVAPQDIAGILIKPFPINRLSGWDGLATGITAIPDLIANCNCMLNHPELFQETYYELLSRNIYGAVEYQSKSPVIQQEYKLFILKILGRIAMSSQNRQLIWKHLTLRAIQETRFEVKIYYFDLIRITLSSRIDHLPFGMYMESVYLPIFSNLKPSKQSGSILFEILNNSVITNQQLRYLICDKSLFRTQYNLPREKQAILLFNIAAYLSSLVTPSPLPRSLIDEDNCDNEFVHNSTCMTGPSLLIMTLLEVVQNWTSSTKILIRTYQHSKYITYALVVLLRYAVQYDKRSLVDHAAQMQTMIARSIPTYLNRTSQELRNLATCLSALVMPKLHDLVISKRSEEIAKDGVEKQAGLKLNFNVDLNDDLLYMQQLFQQKVEVLFQDLPDIMTATTTSPPLDQIINTTVTKPARLATFDEPSDPDNKVTHATARRTNVTQLRGDETKVIASGDTITTTTSCRAMTNRTVVELNDQECESEAKDNNNMYNVDDDDEDDDLKPYKIDHDDEDGEQVDNSDDDDELALSEDAAANVPIYLRDCINGLIENNSRLYVRLCLIKAGALIDALIEQDESQAHDDSISKSQSISSITRNHQRIQIGQPDIAGRLGRPSVGGTKLLTPRGLGRKVSDVNDTIKDVGVELTRALLFLEDQFKTKNFKELRMNCLISLCYAAPDLIGGYLIEEYNGQSRSLQQQLDILHVLVASAHQLSTGSRVKHVPEIVGAAREDAVCSVKISNMRKVNNFAPHAAMYFYGIVYRLRADFVDAGSLVMSQPKSIMSAFRQQTDQEPRSTSASGSQQFSQNDVIIKRAIANGQSQKEKARPAQATSRVLDDTEEAVENFLESNCLSDDSLLLSRILNSIANIINCSSQQIVTCKLSSDLLDILSAYRCHPDSGVQTAIVNCLRMIRDCTPSTYYKEYIDKRMAHMFGPWLSSMST